MAPVVGEVDEAYTAAKNRPSDTRPATIVQVTARSYAHVRYPWRAVVDLSSDAPKRFYASLIAQTMNYRLLSRRPAGALIAPAGRIGMPTGPVAALVAKRARRRRGDIDERLALLLDRWGDLASEALDLPRRPPRLSALVLERSAGSTLFAFGERPYPLLVAKVPAPGDPRVDREAAALVRARPAHVAPRSLGRVGDMRVQEGAPGVPFRLSVVTPRRARRLTWGPAHAALAASLGRLATATRQFEAPDELDGPTAIALSAGVLSSRARDLVQRATESTRAAGVSVLRHGDTSPQNCLFHEGTVTLVDWELAMHRGVPGSDVLNAAVAIIELGAGLARWNEDRLFESFVRTWRSSGYGEPARAAARSSLEAAGLDPDTFSALELAFFARRLGRRVERPDAYPTSAAFAARVVEFVCALS